MRLLTLTQPHSIQRAVTESADRNRKLSWELELDFRGFNFLFILVDNATSLDRSAAEHRCSRHRWRLKAFAGTHTHTFCGGARRMILRSSLSNSQERSSENAIDGENSNSSPDSSAEDVRHNRPNVRRYVRSSTAKRDWAIGDIHERFVRAVDQLGGQDKATPKKILQLMEFRPEGLTLGQVKSHLQMHRKPAKEPSGLSEESTPRSDQRQSHPHRIQPGQGTSVTSLQLGQPKSGLDDMAENPLIEGAAALLQLKEDSGRSADAAGEELLRGSPSEHIESMQTEKMETPEIFSGTLRDGDYVQTGANMEHEFRQQDPGRSSNCKQPLRSFLCETSTSTSSSNPVDVTKSLSGCKRIAEEGIELELTMATRSRRPNFQFASPSTQEEADLDLGLA